jgi:hypothetical protein
LAALDDAGRRTWERCVADVQKQAISAFGPRPWAAEPDDATLSELATVDWLGFPARVATCVGRRNALALLDWRGDRGNEGRRRLQEEYIEWRVVRDSASAIQRLEFTTELAAYWRVLAGYCPAEALRVLGEFSGENVPAHEIYGRCDPFAAGTTPEDRAAAFGETMLTPGLSPYNNGDKAICCMVQPTNTLAAMFRLAVGALCSQVTQDPSDGAHRCLTIDEAAPLLRNAAAPGRTSDPVLVERLGRIACEGRRAAVDDPVGVYIQSVEHGRLRAPNGSEIPSDWFTFGRGLGPADTEDGLPRYQRLTFEVPEPAGFRVSDVVDVATEQPIRFGGQIAELVRLAVFLRASAPGAVADAPTIIEISRDQGDPGCGDVRDHYHEFERAAT